MTVPLVLLAAGAAVAGFAGVPAALGGTNAIEQFLEPSFTVQRALERAPAASALPGTHGEAAHLSPAGEIGLMVLSVAVALAGIALAWRAYVQRPELAERLAARFPRAHRLLTHKYYVDEFYGATAVRGTILAALASWRIDQWVIDGLVNASGWMTRAAAWFSGLADRHAVDGLVDGTGRTLYEASLGFRRLQTGLVQTYALLIVGGVFALVSLYLFVR
jgi:NADH-quinone oxidoreductase subunit L